MKTCLNYFVFQCATSANNCINKWKTTVNKFMCRIFYFDIFHGNKWDLYLEDAALVPAVLLSLRILPFVFPSLLFVFVLPPSICRVSIGATGAKGWGGHFTL